MWKARQEREETKTRDGEEGRAFITAVALERNGKYEREKNADGAL